MKSNSRQITQAACANPLNVSNSTASVSEKEENATPTYANVKGVKMMSVAYC